MPDDLDRILLIKYSEGSRFKLSWQIRVLLLCFRLSLVGSMIVIYCSLAEMKCCVMVLVTKILFNPCFFGSSCALCSFC